MNRRARLLSLAVALVVAGCAGTSPYRLDAVREKLARVGLDTLSEEEAYVPASEHGRSIPCRVIAGFEGPPVPAHPAGYLITGVDRGRETTRAGILEALAAWAPGETLTLTLRRNRYLDDEAAWYEVEVPVRLP